MSNCLYLGCKDCMEYIWIGQRYIIYSGNKETMESLTEFLFKHKKHNLIFNDTDYFSTPIEWVEIEDKPEEIKEVEVNRTVEVNYE